MTYETLIIILLIWLASNICVPLFIRSLDRLYNDKIDKIVTKTFSGTSYVFNRIMQLILIVLFLPTLVVIIFLLSFKNKNIQEFLAVPKLDILPQLLFDKKFTIMKFFAVFNETSKEKN